MRTIPKDYYKILEVAEDAESAEIKKKYRHLAMEYHPDHNPGDPKCEEKFKEISEAYGVLIDPVKRREYDRYRAGAYSGTYGDSSQFRYSQQDIFENMFRSAAARDIFKELNREFSRSGFRSGPGFFQSMFFGGGAMGGLTRLLWLLPGPLGRVGQVIRLVQMVGTSLFALNRVRQVYQKNQSTVDGGERANPLVDSIKGLFGMQKNESTLDINFQIIIPPSEAVSGAKKEISYQLHGQTERLSIRIPPGVRSGQKLRIKEKGHQKNGRRGDLILLIQVESE